MLERRRDGATRSTRYGVWRMGQGARGAGRLGGAALTVGVTVPLSSAALMGVAAAVADPPDTPPTPTTPPETSPPDTTPPTTPPTTPTTTPPTTTPPDT